MDRLNATHLKALEFEREQFLKHHHLQGLARQARREHKTRENKTGWTRVLRRVFSASFFIFVFSYLLLAICRENLQLSSSTLKTIFS
jgi:hypothetical protein